MWSRLGLPKPDRLVVNRRYADALSAIYAFSSASRGAAEIRADRPKKPARLKALLQELGDPQSSYQCVLVAGTKGKGSTTAMIASMLQAAGLRVGRYTQPHLVSWRERTWVNGHYLSIDETIRLLPLVEAAARRLEVNHPELGFLTTFEIGTALSLLSFGNARVDVAIVEVGVGGRNDATNALDPAVSVITPISFDHADVIGPTIRDIAREKSGVMRPGSPAIVATQPGDAAEEILAEAERLGASVDWIGQDWCWRRSASNGDRFSIHGPGVELTGLGLPLLGGFQRDNATAAAVAVINTGLVGADQLERAVKQGLGHLVWPGRVHMISERPRVIFDGAHNAESARQLVSTVHETSGDARVHWVVGLSRGKDVDGFLDAIADSVSSFTATTASHVRSIPADELAALAQARFKSVERNAKITACPNPQNALAAALEKSSQADLVCAAGSFFLLGDLYSEQLRVKSMSR